MLKRILGLISVFLLFNQAHAAGSTMSAIEALQTFNRQTSGLSGDFLQVVTSHNKVEKSQGRFAILRPHWFYWNYEAPQSLLIVGDGQHVWLYDKDLGQVSQTNQQVALGDSPAAILAGNDTLTHNYDLSEDGSENGVNFVKAMPKNANMAYQVIRLGFSGSLLKQMALQDQFGNKIMIYFNNLSTKTPDKKLFRFTPPEGVDVLVQ